MGYMKKSDFFLKKERRPLPHINIIVYLDCDLDRLIYIMNCGT